MKNSKTILVTGATSGFGAEISKKFASEGHNVVAVGRREERLNALSNSTDGQIIPLCFDVTKEDSILSAIEAKLPAELHNIDVLVNNAGMSLGFGPAQSNELDDWIAMVDTNVNGVLRMTNALLPGMVERDHGHIINVGSIAASYPYLGSNVYGGTKAFVRQFSLNLRSDLFGTQVRVTCVEPGMAKTEFALVRYRGDKDKADDLYNGIQPLKAEDMAQTVYWAVSQPEHVNVNLIELVPTEQKFGFEFKGSTKNASAKPIAQTA